MEIVASAFVDGGEIPRRHTQDGEYWSPPLAWSRVPGEARRPFRPAPAMAATTVTTQPDTSRDHRLAATAISLDCSRSTPCSLCQATRAQVDAAMDGHIIARAQLMGTYQLQTR